MTIDYQKIIDYYFPEGDNNALREILLKHSHSVAELAVRIVDAHPELCADRDFVFAAAMLHDIGIVRCDAEGISCFGTEPYICHGMLGAQMLREYAGSMGLQESVEPYARVCARHTGTGLTAEAIRRQSLPLPEQDLTPETEEEQIVCYADKFFSKTKLDKQKTFEQAERSLMKFGEEGLKVFRAWNEKFGGLV